MVPVDEVGDIGGNGVLELIQLGVGMRVILWKKSFPVNIGAPAIAEIDGNMQIVVICEDGYVYGLGSSEQ